MNNFEMEKILESKFGVINIEKELEEAEKELNAPNTKYYTHEEMQQIIRKY